MSLTHLANNTSASRMNISRDLSTISAGPKSQSPLDKLLSDPKSDPILYTALMKGCNPEPSSEQVASIDGKQFVLNLLEILRGSDSALKQRLDRLLPELFNSVFDETTSKLVAEQLTNNKNLVSKEMSRLETERKALHNLSAAKPSAVAA